MKVLFNADDFGLTKGVTDGIIKAHTEGVVGSTTLIMNGHAIHYAIEQAKKYPQLKTGVHLVLSWGKPISCDVPHLIDEHGNFKFTSRMTEVPHVDEVKREWTAQIDAFLQSGLPLHHLDSHHHVHGWEPLRDVIIGLARTYSVPIRYVDSLRDYPDILLTHYLWRHFYADGVTEDIFQELKQLSIDSVEVMTHPAFIDDELRNVSSYVNKRQEELAILCSVTPPDWVQLL